MPELTTHFDDDMIVMEKWNPKKPISAIYYDGEKERYYVKRFLVENTSKVEQFITDHPKSQLEIVMTDWRPMAEVIFYKQRGKDQKPDMEVNLEEFISVKGIKALGNQLTTDKVRQINILESLPYEEKATVTAEEMEVVDEETVESDETTKKASKDDDSDEKPSIRGDGHRDPGHDRVHQPAPAHHHLPQG